MIGNFPVVLNFNHLFLKLNRFNLQLTASPLRSLVNIQVLISLLVFLYSTYSSKKIGNLYKAFHLKRVIPQTEPAHDLSITSTRISPFIVPGSWAAWARSHLHLVGPRPLHASFTAQSSGVGTLPRWELMWQYLVKITNIQVDITFIVPNLIDEVPSHVKGA